MTYRQGPVSAPLARVEGRELHVQDGTRLPRVCILCGVTRRLQEDEHALEWRPAGAVVLLSFGWVGRLLAGNLRRVARLTYSTCKACRFRERNARDMMSGLVVAVLVIGIVAATVGLNGYPAYGVLVAIAGSALFVFVVRRFAARRVRVAYIHSNGTVAMRGVHVALARAAVENAKDAGGHALEAGDEDDDQDEDEDEDDDEVEQEDEHDGPDTRKAGR